MVKREAMAMEATKAPKVRLMLLGRARDEVVVMKIIVRATMELVRPKRSFKGLGFWKREEAKYTRERPIRGRRAGLKVRRSCF